MSKRCGVISKAATIIAEGEVLQLSKTRDLAASAGDYDQVIGAKTATLFEAATEVGAMAGGADAAGRKALRDYGRELGLAFQLVDDVLDYRGESGAAGQEYRRRPARRQDDPAGDPGAQAGDPGRARHNCGGFG